MSCGVSRRDAADIRANAAGPVRHHHAWACRWCPRCRVATASASSPVSAAGGSDARLASTPPPQAGSGGRGAGGLGMFARGGRNPAGVQREPGRACWRMLATSRADSRAFTPTCQAPARLQANSDTTMAAQFSPTSMTRSPRATPWPASQAAPLARAATAGRSGPRRRLLRTGRRRRAGAAPAGQGCRGCGRGIGMRHGMSRVQSVAWMREWRWIGWTACRRCHAPAPARRRTPGARRIRRAAGAPPRS